VKRAVRAPLSSLTGGPTFFTWQQSLSWGFGLGPGLSYAAAMPVSWLTWSLFQRLDSLPWTWTCLVVWTLGYAWFPSLDFLCLPCSGVVGLPFCPWNLCGCLLCFHSELLAQLTLLKQHLTWLLSHTREMKGSYQLQIVNEAGRANLKETIDLPVDCKEPADSLCSMT